ncbi:hypothetical protein MRB53_041167 [Persea americana]|nr:hypothetical protein MRB53_041167 [Persea americana]
MESCFHEERGITLRTRYLLTLSGEKITRSRGQQCYSHGTLLKSADFVWQKYELLMVNGGSDREHVKVSQGLGEFRTVFVKHMIAANRCIPIILHSKWRRTKLSHAQPSKSHTKISW